MTLFMEISYFFALEAEISYILFLRVFQFKDKIPWFTTHMFLGPKIH